MQRMDERIDHKIGIGIVGLGYMGRHHLLALRKLEQDGFQCRVIGVCDTDIERIQSVTAKHPVEFVTSNPNELVEDDRIEAIFVATPWPLHRSIVEKVILLGKHVYCEKPLGVDLEEAQYLAALAEKQGVINQAGLCLRHQPSIWKIQEMVKSGSLGRHLFTLLREDSHLPEAGAYYQSDLADRLFRRGILWEESIHDIDTLIYLHGGLVVDNADVTVSDALGVDTAARIHFKTKSGSDVFFCSLWHGIEGRGSNRHIEMFFTDAVIVSDYFTSGDIVIHPCGKTPLIREEHSLRREYGAAVGFNDEVISKQRYPWYAAFSDLSFVDSILKRKQAYPDFKESVQAHSLAEQIYRESIK